jgi:hypothetical protein
MHFQYDLQHMRSEVYKLLTIVEASPALAAYKGSDKEDARLVARIRGDMEQPEISRLVLSLAAMARSALDVERQWVPGEFDRRERKIKGLDAISRRVVGEVLSDSITTPLRGASEDSEVEFQPLQFREACNKVLHAFIVFLEQDPANTALTGHISLVGERPRGKNSEPWQAIVDLRKFAVACLDVIAHVRRFKLGM